MKSVLAGRRRAASSSAAAVAVAFIVGAAALGYGLYSSATMGGEIATMNSTLGGQNAEINALQAQFASLQGKLSSVGSQLNATEATVASLTGSETSLQEKLSAASGQLNATAADIASLQGKLIAVGDQLNSTQAVVTSLRGNVTSLQEELAAVTAQLDATGAADSAALAQLQQEVLGLNATIQQLIAQSGPPGLPALVQQAESTCSYVCASGSAQAMFSGYVRSGDMLVVTVVSDDLTNLVVTDSMGTRITLAVSATTSPDCISNTGTCQADIYWGLLPSSGPESISVSEGSSARALRVAIWEFRGVGAVKSAVSCAPTCASASYSSGDILIATAMNVNGSGPGFAWSPYAASGVAGSEYQVATGPGTTTFPFSTFVTGDINVEAGAVLGPSS